MLFVEWHVLRINKFIIENRKCIKRKKENKLKYIHGILSK